MVMMALPTTTKGLRARSDPPRRRRHLLGSSAARGLRGKWAALTHRCNLDLSDQCAPDNPLATR